jgi:hypothetical protein
MPPKTSKSVPRSARGSCNYNKSDCLERNFECQWIVGQGCFPREGAKPPSPNSDKLDFTSLPPDVKKLISSKLSVKNATALKATDKENYKLITGIKYTNDDYMEYALKPYTKKILKSLKTYEKTFRKDVDTAVKSLFKSPPDSPDSYYESPPYKSPELDPIINKLNSAILNDDDPRFVSASTIMKKNPVSNKTEIKTAVLAGLSYANRPNLPNDPNYDLNEIKTMNELKKYITYKVAKDYQKSYRYSNYNRY